MFGRYDEDVQKKNMGFVIKMLTLYTHFNCVVNAATIFNRTVHFKLNEENFVFLIGFNIIL